LTYQKFLLCISSQGQDLYSHQKLNMCWFSSESGYRRRRQHWTPQYNHYGDWRHIANNTVLVCILLAYYL